MKILLLPSVLTCTEVVLPLISCSVSVISNKLFSKIRIATPLNLLNSKKSPLPFRFPFRLDITGARCFVQAYNVNIIHCTKKKRHFLFLLPSIPLTFKLTIAIDTIQIY